MHAWSRLAHGLAIAATAILTACGQRNPAWLLIEYPDASDQTVMRFPGARADKLEECQQQARFVTEKLRTSTNEQRRLLCGSNCRFSVDMGSPLCDELVPVYPATRGASE